MRLDAMRGPRAAIWSGFVLAGALLLAPAARPGGQPDLPGALDSQRGAPNLLRDALKDPEKFWPTPHGPSYANVITDGDNFLECKGGPFALCYYSGPEPLECELSPDGRTASCKCLDIAYGVYYVDINAILDFAVYQQTVKVCGADGSQCKTCAPDGSGGESCQKNTNQAPVCGYINENKLFAQADRISTFCFDCAVEAPIGQTECNAGPYAGCMTAPCTVTDEEGIVECQCPIFDGPYQVGQTLPGPDCTSSLAPAQVWSAAYAVSSSGSDVGTAPDLGAEASCTPDVPVEHGGCPLLPAGPIPPPPPFDPNDPNSVSCDDVCAEYAACTLKSDPAIEAGFTCDATLCTTPCTDRDLVEQACSGLGRCDVESITKLETQMGCSCCASQICGCEANAATDTAVYELDQEQRDRGLVPQCDLNGTLCGSAP